MPGLSPRVRGNLRSYTAFHGTGRVYPRVCGGTRYSERCRNQRKRSIPACAGEPRCFPLRPDLLVGLSPRVRGNRECPVVRLPVGRSIPACAGEPDRLFHPSRASTVYPRVCGGTARLISTLLLIRVYPRVCGGTLAARLPIMLHEGLSPRVRGNPSRLRRYWGRLRRSIPACAGEPRSVHPAHVPLEVYPRVCGGTVGTHGECQEASRVYPRVCGGTTHDAVVA